MSEVHMVTGASSGVGRALCLKLASHGLAVLAVARRAGELERLRAENPAQIAVLPADLSDPASWAALAGHVAGRHRVRTLTHSAALSSPGYLKDLDYPTYRATMALNLEAPLFVTQALLPHFAAGARILHLSSLAAHRASMAGGLYSISKAALLMLYRAWNADFPNGEILVGSASPGVVDTPMQEQARNSGLPGAEMFREFKDKGLLLQPSRVAEFLHWLLTGTSDKEFSARDWHISEKSHHAHWLRGSLT